MITQNIFRLPNIKFLLNIQINTPNTKHFSEILVILVKSQSEIRLEISTEIPSFKNIHIYFPICTNVSIKR